MSLLTDTEQSVWSSVNDMLIQNSCWICLQPFMKKKTKKVFQITHLLRYLKDRKATMQKINTIVKKDSITPDEVYDTILTDHEKLIIEDVIEKEIPHLSALWVRFCEIEGNESIIEAEIEKAEIATWMSGLVCCQNELCYHTYSKLVPEDESNKLNDRTRLPAKPTGECPPNCGCDNPWQNIGAALSDAMNNNNYNTNSNNIKLDNSIILEETIRGNSSNNTNNSSSKSSSDSVNSELVIGAFLPMNMKMKEGNDTE